VTANDIVVLFGVRLSIDSPKKCRLGASRLDVACAAFDFTKLFGVRLATLKLLNLDWFMAFNLYFYLI